MRYTFQAQGGTQVCDGIEPLAQAMNAGGAVTIFLARGAIETIEEINASLRQLGVEIRLSADSDPA